MPGSHGVHALAAHASPRSLLTGRADWSEPWLHSPAPMTEARGLQPLPLISKSRWSFGPQDRAHRLAPAWGHRMPGSPVRRTQALGGPHCPQAVCLAPPSTNAALRRPCQGGWGAGSDVGSLPETCLLTSCASVSPHFSDLPLTSPHGVGAQFSFPRAVGARRGRSLEPRRGQKGLHVTPSGCLPVFIM